MSIVLLDTNVISYIMEKHSLATEYRSLIRGDEPVISFASVAELYEGAYRASWGPKRFRRLMETLESYPLLQSTESICQRWGEVRYQRRRQPISAQDAWIAATALVYDLPLVTHNPGDFDGIPGLRVITAKR